MSFRDRLRARISHGDEPGTWDDVDVEAVAAWMTDLASAWDPDPTDPRTAVSRAAALGAFAEWGAGEAPAQLPAPAGAGRPVVMSTMLGTHSARRRPAMVLATVTLLLAATGGAVLASAPGGPLYDIRIATEALGLPSGPDDRARAEIARLDARVTDATNAASRGDATGLTAALRAYARIATEAAAAPPVDPVNRAGCAARVATQLGVLARIGLDEPATRTAQEQVRVAGRLLLRALGGPEDVVLPSEGPIPTGAPTVSPPASPTPDRSHEPTRRPSGGPTSDPGGGAATPSPGGGGGGGATTDPGGGGATTDPGGSGATTEPGGGGGATTDPGGSGATTEPGGGGATTDPGGSGATTEPGGGGGATTDPGGDGTRP
jgi:hypothetical protein